MAVNFSLKALMGRLKRFKELPRVYQLVSVAAFVALIIVIIGVVVGLRHAQRSAADEIIATANQVDTVIVHVDEVLTVGLTKDSPQEIDNAQKELTVATRQINQAIASAEKLKKKSSSNEKKRVELIQNSLGVRAYILSIAPELLRENKQAALCLLKAEEAWNHLTKGLDTQAKAQKLQTSSKEADISEALELEKQAANSYKQALETFAQARSLYEGADFDAYERYAQLCATMSEKAQAADEALLKKDKKAALDAIKQYNESSKAAAILATKELKPLNSVIMAAYKSNTTDLSNQYFSAREKVSVIDRQIR